LHDICYAEQIVNSLPKTIDKATKCDLIAGSRATSNRSTNRSSGLRRSSDKLGQQPSGTPSTASSEADETAEEIEDKGVLDEAVEHYEMCLADRMGRRTRPR
jgi:hypothetical protein